MNREYEPKDRNPLAKMAEEYFKNKDSWSRCDSERMSGRSDSSKPTSYNRYSDKELIEKYIQELEQNDKWSDDRR